MYSLNIEQIESCHFLPSWPTKSYSVGVCFKTRNFNWCLGSGRRGLDLTPYILLVSLILFRIAIFPAANANLWPLFCACLLCIMLTLPWLFLCLSRFGCISSNYFSWTHHSKWCKYFCTDAEFLLPLNIVGGRVQLPHAPGFLPRFLSVRIVAVGRWYDLWRGMSILPSVVQAIWCLRVFWTIVSMSPCQHG